MTHRDAAPVDADTILLDFVRERDVPCPACRYNLRNLVRPVCPECKETLALQVGYARLAIGIFVMTMAPSIFSGICAGFVTVIFFVKGMPPIEFLLLPGFGYLSCIAGTVLLAQRDRFHRLRRRAKLAFLLATWTIHLIAFGLFLLTVT